MSVLKGSTEVRRLDLKVGFICNNYCLHCVQGDKRTTFGNKPLEQLNNELKAGCKNCGEVVLTGGEPTMHKHYFELIRYAKKMGFKAIQIQSNGRRFAYEDFCIESIDAGANVFCLALHGHTAKLHDHLTGANGSFAQTTGGIKNLKALGMSVVTNTVISKINYKYLPQIAQLLVSLGVDQYQLAFPHPDGRAGENFDIIVPRMKKIMPFVKKGLDIGIAAQRIVMTEAIPYCLMLGYHDRIAERRIPSTDIVDADFVIHNFEKYRVDKGKLKGPKCVCCKYYSLCEGPWREYPERFGWEEFVPVK